MFDFFKSYKYVSVCFAPGSDIYYYVTTINGIRAGDVVIVPTERGPSYALVLGTEIYSGNKTPYPVRETKQVIAKADSVAKSQFLQGYEVANCALPANKRKKHELTHSFWRKAEPLFGEIFYKCGTCGAVFNFAPPACPQCHAEMRRVKYDPQFVDELEMYEELFEDDD